MKWTALPIAGLLALFMAVPSLAQDEKKDGTEARKVMLKQKISKDLKVTEESGAETTQTVTLENGMVVQSQVETEYEVQITEYLEVAEDGTPTKLRVRWTESGSETVTSQMNQQGELVEGEPVEEEGAHKGASILHTWNAEKKAWESTLEKGDKEASEVQKQLGKKDPLANPMMPNREVKVGEEWKADEQGLKDFFATPDGPKIKKAGGTLKAEEILEEDGVEYLRVSFDLTLTLDAEGEELPVSNKGDYYFNIKEGRVVAVEMEMGAELENEHPQFGKMAITIEGVRAIEASFGKVGDKDDAEDEEDVEDEDGGMDG